MKAYKGFNRDMTCRGFKFEEGKEYEQSGEIKVCENGFHACERPLDCFAYYSPGESVYHEVELNGEISKSNDDTKIASRKIKIGAQLNIAGLVKAQFKYVKENTTTENTDSKTANAGYRGAANAGSYGAANACDYGAANAGNYGAANAGNYGAANAGNYGAAISRGSSAVGENGVALVRGRSSYGNKVKGGIGSILIFVLEKEGTYEIEDWEVVVVDGKAIKADTWYKFEKGEIVEVKE